MFANPEDNTRTFCEWLATVAAGAPARSTRRPIAKSRAPLKRNGQALGELDVRMWIDLDEPATSTATLLCRWPDAAAAHSAVEPLAAWVARSAEATPAGVAVDCRAEPVTSADGTTRPGTRLKACFRLLPVPDAAHELIALAVRTGLARELRAQVDRAAVEAAAVERATDALAAAALATATFGRGTDTGDDPSDTVSSDTASPDTASDTASPASPGSSSGGVPAPDPAADAVSHGAVFDPGQHPRVDVNGEVTNSEGVTFRLITKRVHGLRKRVWSRVASAATAR